MVQYNTVWDWLESWSTWMFLAGGVLVLIQTIGDVLTLTMDMDLEALAFVVFLGLILSYIGLLGLYPRVADQAPRLSRAGLMLVLVPVLLLIVLTVALLASSGPPFSESVGAALFMAIFVGFAVGVVLFGVAILQTGTPSRAVGISLLGFAAGWFVLLGASIIYGFPISEWLTFLSDGIMAISLLATGFLLYTGASPLGHTETSGGVPE